MKVTQETAYRSLLGYIERSSSRLQDLRGEAASGKKINRASDDPASIRAVLNTRNDIKATDRYFKTSDIALSRLQVLDNQMDTAENIMTRAKEISVGAINDTASTQDRAVMADEIRNLREELFTLANRKFDGRYIFSGYEEGTAPFSDNPAYPATSTNPYIYNGDSGEFKLEIAPGEQVGVNLAGDQLFLGAGGGVDLFETLDQMEIALRADDSAAASAVLDTLETGADQIRELRSQKGLDAAGVETAQSQMDVARSDFQEILSRYQDADFADVITQMTKEEAALEAAMNVTSKVSRLSILNFLG